MEPAHGRSCRVADGATLYNISPITIHEFGIVSQGAHLCTGSHDYNNPTFQLIAAPIVVQRHAWICAEAFLSPGVTVPEGAVVAPRAVVTKSLPYARTVYGGVPASRSGNGGGRPDRRQIGRARTWLGGHRRTVMRRRRSLCPRHCRFATTGCTA